MNKLAKMIKIKIMLAALFLLGLLFPTALAARVLLTGSTIKYSGNHMKLLEIGGELARRGHEVYYSIAKRITGEN